MTAFTPKSAKPDNVTDRGKVERIKLSGAGDSTEETEWVQPALVVSGLTGGSSGAAATNRTAIQAALDAAGALGPRTALSGGGTVTGVGRVQLAPVGVVWIDTTVTVPNNVVFDLNGCRLTLANGASTTVAPKSVVKFAGNSSMAGVINGTLDANGANQTDTNNASHGLDFDRTGVGELYDGCLFARDVMAVNASKGAGFNAAGSAVTAVLERCQAYFCRAGFWGKTDSEFIGCVSGNASWRGFHFYAGTSVLVTACKSFGSAEADWSISYCNNYTFVGCQSEDFGTLAGWVLTASNYISIKGGITYRCALAGQQTALWIEDDTAGNECHHLDIDMTIDSTSGAQPISYALTTRQLGEQCKLRLQVGTVGAVWQNLGGDGLEIADVTIGNEGGIQQVAYAASVTPDPKAGGTVVVGALTGNMTVNNPASAVPGTLLEFHFVQDGTGGRTVSWGANYQSGASVSATAGARSVVQFRCVSPTAWRLVQTSGGGGSYQPLDDELTAIAGLVSAADRLPYFTGSGAAALATFTAAGRALVDDADAAAQRATLGLDYTTLDERTRDTMGTALVAGSNVTITPNDGADTITIAASGGGGSARHLGGYAKTGRWQAHSIPYTATGAVNDLGEANLIAVPLFVVVGGTLDRIACKTDSAGSAGALIRMGIYADDGTGYPGALVLDAGTVAPAAFGIPTITISQAVSSQTLYWLALAVQGAAATRPTINRHDATVGAIARVSFGAAAAVDVVNAGVVNGAFLQAGVTGAFPSTFTTTVTYHGQVPLIAVRWA